MADYVLHCFAQSGHAYKVALCLELAAADWTPRFVDYFRGATRTPEYRAINVMGEVPVLEHGAVTLTQSGVILDYLAERYPRFGVTRPDDRREVLRWLLFDNHKLTSYTATLRYLRMFAKEPEPAVMAFLRTRCESAWSVLNAHLADKTYVVGERLTIADLSLCGYLFWPDEIGVEWSAYPHLRDWLQRIAAEPRYAPPYALMPGHPLPGA